MVYIFYPAPLGRINLSFGIWGEIYNVDEEKKEEKRGKVGKKGDKGKNHSKEERGAKILPKNITII